MQIIAGGSGIKSVVRGTAYLNGVSSLNVTIVAVNLAKSFVRVSHRVAVGGSDLSTVSCSAKFNSATELGFSRGAATGACWVEWEVVEYV